MPLKSQEKLDRRPLKAMKGMLGLSSTRWLDLKAELCSDSEGPGRATADDEVTLRDVDHLTSQDRRRKTQGACGLDRQADGRGLGTRKR